MEKRVRIFVDASPYDLEAELNNFLDETIGKLHDIVYQAVYDNLKDCMEYSSILVYTPEEQEK